MAKKYLDNVRINPRHWRAGIILPDGTERSRRITFVLLRRQGCAGVWLGSVRAINVRSIFTDAFHRKLDTYDPTAESTEKILKEIIKRGDEDAS